jgi:hypothetical protein
MPLTKKTRAAIPCGFVAAARKGESDALIKGSRTGPGYSVRTHATGRSGFNCRPSVHLAEAPRTVAGMKF